MIGLKFFSLFFVINSLHCALGWRWINDERKSHLRRDNLNSSPNDIGHMRSREAWEFDQDDIFMKYVTAAPTITSPPTTSPAPSDNPTSSVRPTHQPSSQPSSLPSLSPSNSPSIQPTSSPTLTPTSRPTGIPSNIPSLDPTEKPSSTPSSMPSSEPSFSPSTHPSITPSSSPSAAPSIHPSSVPSNSPSIHPSDFPSVEPSKEPSSYPSISPTDEPSMTPSQFPTDHPSQSPTDVPTKIPSPSPSANPTASNAPSSSPTISMAPSLVISTTSINKFTIVLTSPPNTPRIDPSDVIDVARSFLDEYLKNSLPNYLKYRGVDLTQATSKGRRLQTVTTIFCTGEVRFNLFASPDGEMINKYVNDAFSESKSTFFASLKKSERVGLDSLLGVKTNENNKVQNGFNTVHLTIIIGCVSIVVIGVAASYVWKRNQENNVRKRLLRAAEFTRQYKGQPQLDDDCFRDITPEPIQISDDNKALERMVMRARHDRGVMNRANELLLQQSDLPQTYDPTNREVRFASYVHKISSDQVQRQRLSSREDESEVDLYDEVCSHCSNGSSISALSRGGSVATDASSLINLGYNDIESAGDENQNSFSRGHSDLGHGIGEDCDLRPDDTSLSYSTNTKEGHDANSGTKNHSDGNAYFTSQATRQY